MSQNFYLFSPGTLSRKDNSLVFTSTDGVKKFIPIENCESLYCFSEINFNSKLFNFLGQNQIHLHFFDYYNNFTGSFSPKKSLLSGSLLIKQVEHYKQIKKRLVIAKEFVHTATHNILKNVKYYAKKKKELHDWIEQIQTWKDKIDGAKEIPELMGIEGNIRKIYYSCWIIILETDISFTKRVYNPPDNPINAIISFLNGVLYATCLREIHRTHLDPTISFLHEPGTKRYSLALDIAENFKPVYVDRIIFRMFNRKQLTMNDFLQELNCCFLKESSSKKVMKEFDDMIKTVIHHPGLDKKVSYRRLIRLDCYRLVKHILGDAPYSGTKSWW